MADEQKLHDFELRVAESWPPDEWKGSHVLLAVSGGADSVAMLRATASVKAMVGGDGKLFVAHLNHGLRGAAADEDQAWLTSLSERFFIPLEVGFADVAKIAQEDGDGWEAAARTARYEFLRETAERNGARFVATAHTADDQAETVLHRILRGSGMEGIAGIPRVRPLSASVTLVRPLLSFRRADVLDYLSALGQDFRTDATNQNRQWTRNRLRNDLLPQLRELYNAQVDAALTRLAAQARESQEVISGIAEKLACDCVLANGARIEVRCAALVGQPPILVREVFKHAWRKAGWPMQSMGSEEWQLLASLAVNAAANPMNLPGNIRAHNQSGTVVLETLSGRPGLP